jgi:hypothetical protein
MGDKMLAYDEQLKQNFGYLFKKICYLRFWRKYIMGENEG